MSYTLLKTLQNKGLRLYEKEAPTQRAANLSKKDSNLGAFLWIWWIFWENLFERTSASVLTPNKLTGFYARTLWATIVRLQLNYLLLVMGIYFDWESFSIEGNIVKTYFRNIHVLTEMHIHVLSYIIFHLDLAS